MCRWQLERDPGDGSNCSIRAIACSRDTLLSWKFDSNLVSKLDGFLEKNVVGTKMVCFRFENLCEIIHPLFRLQESNEIIHSHVLLIGVPSKHAKSFTHVDKMYDNCTALLKNWKCVKNWSGIIDVKKVTLAWKFWQIYCTYQIIRKWGDVEMN